MSAGPLPADHDCEVTGCAIGEYGYHVDEYGFCLACGGCGDPECCTHDEMCRFDTNDDLQVDDGLGLVIR